jgi:anaerobic selenocysteine-containing dehydrogenase
MGLQTQSGKLEFEASSLKRFDPDDPERAPIMRYVPAWEGPHAEELFAKYPLQLITPHPRHSFHTQSDGKDAVTNDIRDHRVLVDGLYYWVVRMSPRDAAARGLKQHQLVRVFNDRGAVICAVRLTERVPAGTVHSYESSARYEPVGEPGRSADRGGCMNVLTPSRMMIRKAHALAANSCLVQIEAWEGPHSGELYAKYPLQLITPHPRHSFHTQSDGKDAVTNDIRDHRVLIGGRYYWIVRVSSSDAAARGLRQHQLVRVFNDRGAVICAVQLTERVPAGTVHSYESSARYEPVGEPGHSADRGGCMNVLTPSRMMIRKAHALAANSCLVQIEAWEEGDT